MKKFLVMGSNSFSGSHFCNYLLNEGHEVFAASRSEQPQSMFLPYKWSGSQSRNFTFRKIDLNFDLSSFEDILRTFQPTHIVNFSAQAMVAQSWDQPSDWVRTNVEAIANVANILCEYKKLKKFIQITTPEVYGSSPHPLSEDSAFNPSTPYAVSRAAGDMMLQVYHQQHGLPVLFTRAANVYGPGQQPYRIIPKTIIACLSDQKLVLDGGGLSKRSFVHITDVCEITLKLALSEITGDVFNISGKNYLSIRDLVEIILNATDRCFDDVVDVGPERLGKDQAYLLDSSKVEQTFDWKPQISLEHGVGEVVGWVRSNLLSLQDMGSSYVHKP